MVDDIRIIISGCHDSTRFVLEGVDERGLKALLALAKRSRQVSLSKCSPAIYVGFEADRYDRGEVVP